LLATLYVKNKFKMALKCCLLAQKITANLDRKLPRNLDFILSVNLITSIVLLKIGKPVEAFDFILIAENAVESLFMSNLFKPIGVTLKDLQEESKESDDVMQ
jgi:hypothetical protein